MSEANQINSMRMPQHMEPAAVEVSPLAVSSRRKTLWSLKKVGITISAILALGKFLEVSIFEPGRCVSHFLGGMLSDV